MDEVAAPKGLFATILRRIDLLRLKPPLGIILDEAIIPAANTAVRQSGML